MIDNFKGTPAISIVIPVYFNQETLPGLFKELDSLQKVITSVSLDIIFVNDGSTDGSAEMIIEYVNKSKNSQLIQLTRNFGAINASTTGLRYVTGDAVIFLAADLQDPPELIIRMVEAWQAGNKFVICERSTRDDGALKNLFSKIFYFLLTKFVIKDFPRGGFDLSLMDKEMIPVLLESSKTSYIPILAWWQGFKPFTIKYHRTKRELGKSKWTIAKRLNAVIDIFLGFSALPLRALFYIGTVTSLLSMFYGIFIVIQAVRNEISVQGFATIIVLLTFLSGITILGISLIGEYLWRVLEEVNKRPRAIISSIHSSRKTNES